MSGSAPPAVFDRRLLKRRRDRAAAGFDRHDFLVREAVALLAERLGDVRRRFAHALLLGCHTGQLARRLPAERVGNLVQADLSAAMLRRVDGLRVVVDDEALPFGAACFDLVIACCNLHVVNDLPGTLVQIHHMLKPDGLFLAAMPGGRTLHELRESLMRAELAEEGGASPRVAPFVDVPDAGALIQRAGFALPVVDIETVTVTYHQPMKLLRDLQGMGESNILIDRCRRPLRRATLLTAVQLYRDLFGDGRARVPATFQILMLSGWKPDPSQPRPLRRGSGRTSLAEALALPPGVREGGDPP